MGLNLELKIPEQLFNLACKEFEKNWQSDKVVIKRFTYGDNLAIAQASIKIKSTGGAPVNADVNPEEIQLQTILRGVLEAPWGKGDLRSIRELPPFIAEWIHEEIQKHNTLTIEKKE